ncbi:hypothetical protein KKH82_03850 [Patescibacteria group bacterium]|nr:hypothetical protein [Patescibacteria group bacterium]
MLPVMDCQLATQHTQFTAIGAAFVGSERSTNIPTVNRKTARIVVSNTLFLLRFFMMRDSI